MIGVWGLRLSALSNQRHCTRERIGYRTFLCQAATRSAAIQYGLTPLGGRTARATAEGLMRRKDLPEMRARIEGFLL